METIKEAKVDLKKLYLERRTESRFEVYTGFNQYGPLDPNIFPEVDALIEKIFESAEILA